MRWIVLLLGVLTACGDDGGTRVCAPPAGTWDLRLESRDAACGVIVFKSDVTSLGGGSCAITDQDFNESSCVFFQRADCDGYSGTTVFVVNSAGTEIGGTTTIEHDDGTVCDFETRGTK